MELPNRIRMPKRGVAWMALIGFGLSTALPCAVIGAQQSEGRRSCDEPEPEVAAGAGELALLFRAEVDGAGVT